MSAIKLSSVAAAGASPSPHQKQNKLRPWSEQLQEIKRTIRNCEKNAENGTVADTVVHLGLQYDSDIRCRERISRLVTLSSKTSAAASVGGGAASSSSLGELYVFADQTPDNSSLHAYTVSAERLRNDCKFTVSHFEPIGAQVTLLKWIPDMRIFCAISTDLTMRIMQEPMHKCNVLKTINLNSAVECMGYNSQTRELLLGGVAELLAVALPSSERDIADRGVEIRRPIIKNFQWTDRHELIWQIDYEAHENLVIAITDDRILAFDSHLRELRWKLKTHSEFGLRKFLIFLPLHFLMTADQYGVITVWNYMVGIKTHEFLGHTKSITCLAHHDREPILFSGALDKTIRLWRLDHLEALQCFETSEPPITIGVIPNFGLFYVLERRIVRCRMDACMRIFALVDKTVDRVERVEVQQQNGDENNAEIAIRRFAFSRKIRTARLFIVHDDGSFRLVSPQTGDTITVVMPIPSVIKISTYAYDARSNYAYLALQKGGVYCIDCSRNPCWPVAVVPPEHGATTTAIAVVSSACAAQPTTSTRGGGSITSLVFVASNTGTISMMPTLKYEMPRTLQAHTDTIVSLQAEKTVNQQDVRLLSIGGDKTLKIWFVAVFASEAENILNQKSKRASTELTEQSSLDILESCAIPKKTSFEKQSGSPQSSGGKQSLKSTPVSVDEEADGDDGVITSTTPTIKPYIVVLNAGYILTLSDSLLYSQLNSGYLCLIVSHHQDRETAKRAAKAERRNKHQNSHPTTKRCRHKQLIWYVPPFMKANLLKFYDEYRHRPPKLSSIRGSSGVGRRTLSSSVSSTITTALNAALHARTTPMDIYGHAEGMDHQADVISLDSQPNLLIFATTSRDGLIKLWSNTNELIREIDTVRGNNLGPLCFLNHRGDLGVAFANNIVYFTSEQYLPTNYLKRLLLPASESINNKTNQYIEQQQNAVLPFILHADDLQSYKDAFSDAVILQSARHAVQLEKNCRNSLPVVVFGRDEELFEYKSALNTVASSPLMLLADTKPTATLSPPARETATITEKRLDGAATAGKSASQPNLAPATSPVKNHASSSLSSSSRLAAAAKSTALTLAPTIIADGLGGEPEINLPTATSDFVMLQRAFTCHHVATRFFIHRYNMNLRPRAMRDPDTVWFNAVSSSIAAVANSGAIMLKFGPNIATTFYKALQSRWLPMAAQNIESLLSLQRREDSPAFFRRAVTEHDRSDWEFGALTLPFWLCVHLLVLLLTVQHIPNSVISQFVDPSCAEREQLRRKLLFEAKMAAKRRRVLLEEQRIRAKQQKALAESASRAALSRLTRDGSRSQATLEEEQALLAMREDAEALDSDTARARVTPQMLKKRADGAVDGDAGRKQRVVLGRKKADPSGEKGKFLTDEEQAIVVRLTAFVRKHQRDALLDLTFGKALEGDSLSFHNLHELGTHGGQSREAGNFLHWLEHLFEQAALTGDRPVIAGLHSFTARLCDDWLQQPTTEKTLDWKRRVLDLIRGIKLRDKALKDTVKRHHNEIDLRELVEAYLAFDAQSEREEQAKAKIRSPSPRGASDDGSQKPDQVSLSSRNLLAGPSQGQLLTIQPKKSSLKTSNNNSRVELPDSASPSDAELALLAQKYADKTRSKMQLAEQELLGSMHKLPKKHNVNAFPLQPQQQQRARDPLLKGGLGIVFSDPPDGADLGGQEEEQTAAAAAPPRTSGKHRKPKDKARTNKKTAKDVNRNKAADMANRKSSQSNVNMPDMAEDLRPADVLMKQMMQQAHLGGALSAAMQMHQLQHEAERKRASWTQQPTENTTEIERPDAAVDVATVDEQKLPETALLRDSLAAQIVDEAAEAGTAMVEEIINEKLLSDEKRVSREAEESGKQSAEMAAEVTLSQNDDEKRASDQASLSLQLITDSKESSYVYPRDTSDELSLNEENSVSFKYETQRESTTLTNEDEVTAQISVIESFKTSFPAENDDRSSLFSEENENAGKTSASVDEARTSIKGSSPPPVINIIAAPQTDSEMELAAARTEAMRSVISQGANRMLTNNKTAGEAVLEGRAMSELFQVKAVVPMGDERKPISEVAKLKQDTTIKYVKKTLKHDPPLNFDDARQSGIHRAIAEQALTMLSRIEQIIMTKMNVDEKQQLLRRLMAEVDASTVQSNAAAQHFLHGKGIAYGDARKIAATRAADGGDESENDDSDGGRVPRAGGWTRRAKDNDGIVSKSVKVAYAVINDVIKELPDVVKAIILGHFIEVCYNAIVMNRKQLQMEAKSLKNIIKRVKSTPRLLLNRKASKFGALINEKDEAQKRTQQQRLLADHRFLQKMNKKRLRASPNVKADDDYEKTLKKMKQESPKFSRNSEMQSPLDAAIAVVPIVVDELKEVLQQGFLAESQRQSAFVVTTDSALSARAHSFLYTEVFNSSNVMMMGEAFPGRAKSGSLSPEMLPAEVEAAEKMFVLTYPPTNAAANLSRPISTRINKKLIMSADTARVTKQPQLESITASESARSTTTATGGQVLVSNFSEQDQTKEWIRSSTRSAFDNVITTNLPAEQGTSAAAKKSKVISRSESVAPAGDGRKKEKFLRDSQERFQSVHIDAQPLVQRKQQSEAIEYFFGNNDTSLQKNTRQQHLAVPHPDGGMHDKNTRNDFMRSSDEQTSQPEDFPAEATPVSIRPTQEVAPLVLKQYVWRKKHFGYNTSYRSREDVCAKPTGDAELQLMLPPQQSGAASPQRSLRSLRYLSALQGPPGFVTPLSPPLLSTMQSRTANRRYRNLTSTNFKDKKLSSTRSRRLLRLKLSQAEQDRFNLYERDWLNVATSVRSDWLA